ATHFMEHWSDARAFDGTASIVQPLIAPLYGGTSPHELLALFTGDARSGYDIVRETWRDTDWDAALRKGVIDDTAFRPVAPALHAFQKEKPEKREGWNIRFVADASTLDG